MVSFQYSSYLMNLASPDEATLAKSRTVLLDEVQRCERLGLLYYNIHPGRKKIVTFTLILIILP